MEPLSELAREVRDFAHEHALLPRGSTVVVAVSGGPDSVALLHVLRELAPTGDLELVVAHFEHGLRGQESVRDAAFVAALAGRLGLCFERGEGSEYAGGSVEAQARVARYRFLEQIRLRCSADRIALGHTAEDQVETVLLHLARGAGLRGLSGMVPRRGSLVRPFLDAWHGEILEYLESRGHEYRIDSSNLLLTSDRNRLRHAVLPIWNRVIGRWVSGGVHRSTRNLQDLAGYVEGELERMRAVVCDEKEGLASLDISAFGQYHTYLRRELLLRLAEETGAPVRDVGVEGVERLLACCDEERRAARTVIAGGASACRHRGRLYFRPSWHVPVGPFCFRLPVPGNVHVTPAAMTISARVVRERPAWFPGDGEHRACAPRYLLGGSSWLTVRNRRPGDSIRVAPAVTKRLKDLFQERGVAPWARSGTVLVVAEGQPMWVVGLRPAWSNPVESHAGGYVVLEWVQHDSPDR